jgi:hypothetical protein
VRLPRRHNPQANPSAPRKDVYSCCCSAGHAISALRNNYSRHGESTGRLARRNEAICLSSGPSFCILHIRASNCFVGLTPYTSARPSRRPGASLPGFDVCIDAGAVDVGTVYVVGALKQKRTVRSHTPAKRDGRPYGLEVDETERVPNG